MSEEKHEVVVPETEKSAIHDDNKCRAISPSSHTEEDSKNRKRKIEETKSEHENGDSKNRKRKIEESESGPSNKRSDNVVAHHYNQLPERGLAQRSRSKIYFMRNFNNWVKSVLLKTYQNRLRDEGQKSGIFALDLGCGKGGDLLKWSKGNVKKLICTDIASTSIEQCRERYHTNKKRSRGRIFESEFIVADSSRDLLSDMYKDKETKFDLVSSQFVIHYSFESEPQAMRMVQNACEGLRKGGYFVGTTVNEKELRKRLDYSSDTSFGNDIYSVTFSSKDEFKDFGHRYNFHLEGVVDCPEYVAKRDVLERLAEKFGMKLVMWKTFSDFFASFSRSKENKDLLQRIKALENFPNRYLSGTAPGDYDHARDVCDDIYHRHPGSNPKVGTLSSSEWDAASLYVVYAFKKVDSDEEESFDVPQSVRDEIPTLVISW